MSFSDDKELREYRNIMEAPAAGEFRDGFNWKAVAGALFLGFLVNPVMIYLGLVVGNDASVGTAMRWVLVIFFAEVAKRSFTSLRMQELYVLHYMTGAALGDVFGGYLWTQYVVSSEYVQGLGLAAELPTWAFPPAAALAEAGRTLFAKAWLPVIGLTLISMVIGAISNYGLGYVLYRLTSDVEKLPFPFAPMQAAGILALSTDRGEESKWRWRCFSIGGMIGLIWGIIFICVPIVTEAILPQRIELVPLIFADFTQQVTRYLPAVAFNLVINLGAFLVGMIVPFWSIMGGVVGLVITMIANPILQKTGILANWRPEMGFLDTIFINHIDFYLSFGIGLTFAVAFSQLGVLVGTGIKNWLKPQAKAVTNRQSFGAGFRENWKILVTNNKARGDFSIFVAMGIYLLTTASWIFMGIYLVGGYPWKIMIFYALIYNPIISYSTAKLEGICGQAVNIPYLQEITILLSGHKGADIWFAPMPIMNMGAQTVSFRVLELTGTKLISQVKVLLLTLPIVLIASFVTCDVLWRMAPVPSSAYPFTQMMWELNLKMWCVTKTATMEGGSQFLESMHGTYMLWGFGSATILFTVLTIIGLPIMLIFGAVWGLAATTPGAMFCSVAGALVGKYYFKKKYKDMWLKYMMVVSAGFGCGMGLVSMVAMSFSVITRMLSPTMW